MNNSDEKKKGKFALEIIGIFIVTSIFSIILLNYYGAAQEAKIESKKFVTINYSQLLKESELIGNPSLLINESAKNVFVLTYHVVSKYNPEDDYELSYAQFKENMFTLKSLGYQTVSLNDFYLFLSGKKELKDKSFILTFDDGARVSFYNADLILKVLNYTAVMFVITGHSLENNQSSYYLNESELFEVQQSGRWEIESHTHESHYRLPIDETGLVAPALTNKLWLQSENRVENNEEFLNRVTSDLTNAKYLIETTFNKSVSSFALPYGDFGERGSNYEDANTVVYNLTTSLYSMVFYQFPIKNRIFRANYPDLSQNSHLISRLSADSLRTPEKLLQRIEASRNLDLPYIEDYKDYYRWPRISGEANFEKDHILLRTTENSSDDLIVSYLDGSYLWKDYTYSIQLKNDDASTISLLSRLTTGFDYISCQYTKKKIRLVKVTSGISDNLESVNMFENVSLQAGADISMSVKGDLVSCYINGENVLTSKVLNISDHGGVGIKVQDFKNVDKMFVFGNITIVENS